MYCIDIHNKNNNSTVHHLGIETAIKSYYSSGTSTIEPERLKR